jgi:hypothetical protein
MILFGDAVQRLSGLDDMSNFTICGGNKKEEEKEEKPKHGKSPRENA